MVHALNYMYHTMPYQQIQALKDLDSNTDRFLCKAKMKMS